MTAAPSSYYGFLPELLAEIADLAGLDAALKVAEAVGGTRVNFPARPDAGNWLSQLLGMDKAQAICAHLSPGDRGIQLNVPLGPAGSRSQCWRRMHGMIDDGLTKPEVARALGITERTVQRHKNGHSGKPKTDPDQYTLF